MKILIVVDMQNDFVYDALGSPEAQAIVPAVKNRIKEYSEGMVIFTRDTHYNWYMDTQEGKKLPVFHCNKNTHGWEVIDELKHQGVCEIYIDKPTFGSIQLAEMIQRIPEVESIELCGVCTDICVVSNALILKAYFPEVPISVNPNLCAGTTVDNHQSAINTMRSCQIDII